MPKGPVGSNDSVPPIQEDGSGVNEGGNTDESSSSSASHNKNDNNDDDSDFEDDDDESYESEGDDGSGRTLLFLCEEGQLDIALKRVREWDRQCPLPEAASTNSSIPPPAAATASTAIESTEPDNNHHDKALLEATIRRELYRKSPTTGNYCLHEIVAGGTSGSSAPELVERLVRRYTSHKKSPAELARCAAVFAARPTVGSNGRTILHWCAWSKTTPRLLQLVLKAHPEAMCLRDDKSHFRRTPLEIAERYWPNHEITEILRSSLKRYLPHRLRMCVRLCAERLFPVGDNPSATEDPKHPETSEETERSQIPQRALLKPFDKKGRRMAGLAPRPWFVASVLGYALQREMKDLALQILSYVGCGAKLEPKNKRRTKKKQPRKRKAASSEQSNNQANGRAENKSQPAARRKRRRA